MKAFLSSGVLILGTILVATAIYMMLNYNTLETANTEDENVMLTEAYGQNVLSIIDSTVQEQVIEQTVRACCIQITGTVLSSTLNKTIYENITSIQNLFNNAPFNATVNDRIFYGPDISCSTGSSTNNNFSINMTVKGPNTAKNYFLNLTYPIQTNSAGTTVNVYVNSSLAQTKRYNFTIDCSN